MPFNNMSIGKDATRLLTFSPFLWWHGNYQVHQIPPPFLHTTPSPPLPNLLWGLQKMWGEGGKNEKEYSK